MRNALLTAVLLSLPHISLAGEAPQKPALYLGGSSITLANERMLLGFSPSGMTRLQNRVTGAEYLSGERPSPYFNLTVKPVGTGAPRRVAFEEAVLEDISCTVKRLTFHYGCLNRQIIVTLTVSLNEDERSHFQIRVENHSQLEVCEVEFPILQGVRIGMDPTDDTLVMPGVWGQIWKNPAATVHRTQRAMSMRWLDLFDASGGLYAGSHDAGFLDTEVSVNGKDGKSVDLSMKKFVRVPPGGKWVSEDFLLAAHQGDWHWGADRYREWAMTWRKPLPHPDWVNECDGWQAVFYTPFSELPFELERAKTRGLNYLQMWDEMCQRDCDCGTFPYPDPWLGSVEELRDATGEIHSEGGHVTSYINSQLFDPAHCDAAHIGDVPRSMLPREVPIPTKDWFEKNCPRDYTGAWVHYPDSPLVCAAATGWQSHLRYWADQYNRVYGADGIYFDQMGCTNNLCANLNHGHSGYGAWHLGYADNLREIVLSHRKQDPNFVTAIEGCNDVVGQYADFQLASGVMHQGEVYRYTFPEDLLIDGYSNGGVRPDFGGEQIGFNRVFLLGERFDGVPDNEFGRKMMALRKATKQLLYRARFMDTVGLRVRFPEGTKLESHVPRGLEGAEADQDFGARLFLLNQTQTRVALVNMVNVKGWEGVRVFVKTGTVGEITSACTLDFRGGVSPIAFTRNGEEVAFTAPVTTQSTVLLVNRCEPLVYFDSPPNAVAGETVPLKVQLLNVDASPMRAQLSLRGPAGWQAKAVEIGPVATGERSDKILRVKVPASARPGRYGFTLLATTQVTCGTRRAEISIVDPMQIHLEQWGNEVRATFENRGPNNLSIRATMAVSPPLSAAQPSKEFRLSPGSISSQTFKIQGIESLKGTGHITVATNTGVRRSLMVSPPLLNGGFERDDGEDQATYWRTYNPPVLAHTHLDRTTFVEGRQSLRLDPFDAPARFVMSRSTRLRPDTTYRVHAAIRRSKPSTGIWLGVFAYPGEKQMLALGQQETGPVNEWQFFEKTFHTLPGKPHGCWYGVYCYNLTGDATAWFDDIRIAPEKTLASIR